MKTPDIMNVYEYDACGGPIKAVPVTDVRTFVNRMLDRLSDIQDGLPVEPTPPAHQGLVTFLYKELRETLNRLEQS